MCRMFALRSRAPESVAPALAGLKALSHEHRDGWGVARFDDGGLTVESAVTPAFTCARFDDIGCRARTSSMLVHIRKASVGSVCPANTHPFTARGWAFMHNGTLRNFATRRGALEAEIAPRWRATLRGDTDSERCFTLFLSYLDDVKTPSSRDVARALTRVMDTVARVCDGPGDRPSAMNFLAGDGQSVVATRRGRTLVTAHRDGACYIASEPLWEGAGWTEVPEEHLVLCDGPDALSLTHLDDWR